MAKNWGANQQKATKIEVKDNCSIKYYRTASTKTYAGTLSAGTIATVKYIVDKDAMKITACPKKPEAKDKYILSPKNDKGKIVLNIDSAKKSTTEATTTKDKNGNTVPKNTTEKTKTDENGEETTETETSGSDTSGAIEEANLDESFTESVAFKIYEDDETYLNNLSNGLRVKDLRGILGMPHQFLPLTDPRIIGDNIETNMGFEGDFGRVYSEKIIKHIPLLLMTPGLPVFMSGYKPEQKEKMLFGLASELQENFDTIFNDNRVGKYYSLKYAYTEYFHYLNAMLRSAAIFLGVHNETINGKRLDTMDWLYTTGNIGDDNVVIGPAEETGLFSSLGLANYLGPYAGSIAFYADAGTSVDDSFGNSTTESQLASGLNNLSDQAREIGFLLGAGSGALGLGNLTDIDSVEEAAGHVMEAVNGALGSGSVVGSILNKATTILSGGRIIFPEIWSDSSFSRSYSCSMKLVSPSGDRLSVFLNILVPIYHLLAFTLPRDSTAQQAYFSPFMVRAYYKGLFNVDMGIIPGLSVSKGDEGEWTTYGVPTVANVSFEIKDLYDGMYMSKQSGSGDHNIMSNIQELDYIANSCGINVNDQEIQRTVRLYATLFGTNIRDKVTLDIFGNINQYFNQKIQNIFGKF